MSKIWNWPACQDLTDIRGFLGMCGIVEIFIEGFAELAWPLVRLMQKNVEFMGGVE